MRKPLAFLLVFAGLALAEQRGTIEAKGSLGITSFVDEVAINHLQTGGSVRFYLTRNLSIEPEFQYLRQSRAHHDTVVMTHVNWDFRSGQRIVPYVTAGLGWMQSTTRLRGFAPFSERRFRTNTAYAEFGAGSKVRFGQHWYIAPEFRIGTELNARANVALGFTFR